MFHFNRRGVYLNDGHDELGLDARHENVFISHAHADHAFSSKKSRRVMASDATMDLLKARGFNLAGERWRNGFKLLRAGHVLGARQLVAQVGDRKFAYSPDFKLSDSLTVKGAEIPECDDLVVDSTFGDTELPDREQVLESISRWAKFNERRGHTSIIGGYALGKTQELVACLNEYAGIIPVLSGESARITRVYRDHGVKLDFIDSEAEPEALRNGAFTAIVPLNCVNRVLAFKLKRFYNREVRTAAATGWALTRSFQTDAQFPLSDHADKSELLEFIEQSGAERVFNERGELLVNAGKHLKTRVG